MMSLGSMDAWISLAGYASFFVLLARLVSLVAAGHIVHHFLHYGLFAAFCSFSFCLLAQLLPSLIAFGVNVYDILFCQFPGFLFFLTSLRHVNSFLFTRSQNMQL